MKKGPTIFVLFQHGAGNISKKYEITNEYSVELFLHTYLVVKKAARQRCAALHTPGRIEGGGGQ